MNTIRKHIFMMIFVLLAGFVSAQDVDSNIIKLGYPVYSQYLQNGMMINPAYAGSRGALSTFLSYRMQWIGADGSPVFQTVSVNTPMKNDRVALGLTAKFMQYGFTRSSSVYACYAYQIRLGGGKLSFGLKGGFDRSNTDYSGILLSTAGDPVFSGNEKPYMLPNAGAGLYYYSKKLFAGVAVPRFLEYKKTPTGAAQAYHSFNSYDFVMTAGGLIEFSSLVKFKPSVFINYSLQEKLNQFDLNANFIICDLIWLGGSWRSTEEVAVGILQIQANPQLMFGFSYDYPMGRMNNFSKGSTEFILRYEFGYKVSSANPRYF
jgi:type IX secretion system PorP/SprF family membrane protein